MKKSLIILVSMVFFLFSTTVSANKNIEIISKPEDYLVLGSVNDIDEESIVITVDQVLGVKASGLVGEKITVDPFTYSYCTYHAPYSFTKPSVSDNVVISLKTDGEKYVMANGAYKIDTTEYTSCKVISHTDEENEDCIRELAEITCFIRSNAKIKEFSFDSDGNIFAVYPQSMEQCVQVVDSDGELITNDEAKQPILEHLEEQGENPQKEDTGEIPIYSVLIFAVGALLGLLGAYVAIRSKTPKN